MNLVETYMNSQPNEIEAQNIAADSRPFETETQQTVIANKSSQIEDQKAVTISNGADCGQLWYAYYRKQ